MEESIVLGRVLHTGVVVDHILDDIPPIFWGRLLILLLFLLLLLLLLRFVVGEAPIKGKECGKLTTETSTARQGWLDQSLWSLWNGWVEPLVLLLRLAEAYGPFSWPWRSHPPRSPLLAGLHVQRLPFPALF